MRIIQLAREGSPPPGLRLSEAELSRKYNQLARARIRQFESDMPSQAVWSLTVVALATFTPFEVCSPLARLSGRILERQARTDVRRLPTRMPETDGPGSPPRMALPWGKRSGA
jgi:hypothetical protein